MIKAVVALAADKPALGPFVTLSSTVLTLIGAITPYLAFVALTAGLVLTLISIRVKWQDSANAKLQEKKLLAELKVMENLQH